MFFKMYICKCQIVLNDKKSEIDRKMKEIGSTDIQSHAFKKLNLLLVDSNIQRGNCAVFQFVRPALDTTLDQTL